MDGLIDRSIDLNLFDLNWNSASCLEFKIGPEIKVIYISWNFNSLSFELQFCFLFQVPILS